jgi:hypothetical protein
MRRVFESFAEITKSMGRGMVANASFTTRGMGMVGVVETPDPAAYTKALANITAGVDLKDSFMKVSPTEERTVDGTKITSFRLQFVPEKMPGMAGAPADNRAVIEAIYGKEGLQYHFAGFGNRTLFVVGDDDALKRALKAAKAADATPNALSKTLAAAGADTVGFVRMDMRAMMSGMSDVMAGAGAQANTPMPKVPPGEPVLITATANAGSDRLRARLSFDVAKFARLFEAMMPK